jgi:uncharacterized protein YpiB (UPF0302 family)
VWKRIQLAVWENPMFWKSGLYSHQKYRFSHQSVVWKLNYIHISNTLATQIHEVCK